MHIFNEFDTDGDGHITAHEVAAALRSRNVNISDEQAEMFVDGAPLGAAGVVTHGLLRPC